MALRQQLCARRHQERRKLAQLADERACLQHLDEEPRPQSSLGSGASHKRREHHRRCGQPLPTGGRLELVNVRCKQDLRTLGNPGCRPNGLRQVKEGSALLLMEPSRPGSLGNRQPSAGHPLEPVRAPILFPAFPASPAGVGQVSGPGGSSNGADRTLVARKAVLPSTPQHTVGLQEATTAKQPDS